MLLGLFANAGSVMFAQMTDYGRIIFIAAGTRLERSSHSS